MSTRPPHRAPRMELDGYVDQVARKEQFRAEPQEKWRGGLCWPLSSANLQAGMTKPRSRPRFAS